jgi:histone demethylase JARID1
LEESRVLEKVLKNCEEWEQEAHSLLQDSGCIFGSSNIGNGIVNCLISKMECIISKMECVTKSGLSLGFNFRELPELQGNCSALQWCKKALSFCSGAPSFEVIF